MAPYCGDNLPTAQQQSIKYNSSELSWVKETAQISSIADKLLVHLNGIVLLQSPDGNRVTDGKGFPDSGGSCLQCVQCVQCQETPGRPLLGLKIWSMAQPASMTEAQGSMSFPP